MIRGIDGILLGSASATKLAKFYREVVGLKQTMEFEVGEKGEKGFGFDLAGTTLAILDHSKVTGANKNPDRFMINFEVADIDKETARLKKLKAKLKQDIYHVEGYGLIATFIDPDGNFFQMVQVRAAN